MKTRILLALLLFPVLALADGFNVAVSVNGTDITPRSVTSGTVAATTLSASGIANLSSVQTGPGGTSLWITSPGVGAAKIAQYIYSGGLFELSSDSRIAWWNGTNLASGGSADDLILLREAPGVLAQRDGVNAQSYILSKTYTDGGNYAQSEWQYSGNYLNLNLHSIGTGVGGLLGYTITGGNVGIGTTAPSAKLDIKTTTGSVAFSASTLSETTGLFIIPTDASNLVGLYASGAASKNMAFYTGNTEVMRYNTSGNVGIGTTSPTSLLEVNGDASSIHSLTTGTTPTLSVGAGVGTGGTATLSADSTDEQGVLTINAGTLPSVASVAVTGTFTHAYSKAPTVVMWPHNAASAALSFLPFTQATTTTFTINTAAAVSFGGSTTYEYNYLVRGKQ